MTVTSGEEKPEPEPAPAPAKIVSWKVKLLARGIVVVFTLLLLEGLSYAGRRGVAPRGPLRCRGPWDRWLAWSAADPLSGGCFFIAMATDLDGRPGPSRDLLVKLQQAWMDFLADLVRSVVREGQFRPETDPEQFANDMYGVMLAYHHLSLIHISEPTRPY